MIEADTPFPVRREIEKAIEGVLDSLAHPGGSLDGRQRVSIAQLAREGNPTNALESFATLLYSNPAGVTGHDVAKAASHSGFPPVVETIGIISRLAAIDRFRTVIGIELPALPEPRSGPPTGEIATGLEKRRGHVPMPTGAIPVSLDLVPAEGRATLDLHGALYMTEGQMGDPEFAREPGLNTPQLETIATRVSLLNECFY